MGQFITCHHNHLLVIPHSSSADVEAHSASRSDCRVDMIRRNGTRESAVVSHSAFIGDLDDAVTLLARRAGCLPKLAPIALDCRFGVDLIDKCCIKSLATSAQCSRNERR